MPILLTLIRTNTFVHENEHAHVKCITGILIIQNVHLETFTVYKEKRMRKLQNSGMTYLKIAKFWNEVIQNDPII